jgi:hypothetical protein
MVKVEAPCAQAGGILRGEFIGQVQNILEVHGGDFEQTAVEVGPDIAKNK